MNQFSKSLNLTALLSIAGLIGILAPQLNRPANAGTLNNAIATYYSPRAQNPSQKYYVQGGLYAYSRGAQINVRTGPGTHYNARHYGLPGDRVIILNEAYGRDGYRWWYLQFNNSGAKGWIRGDFVAIPDAGLREISRQSRR